MDSSIDVEDEFPLKGIRDLLPIFLDSLVREFREYLCGEEGPVDVVDIVEVLFRSSGKMIFLKILDEYGLLDDEEETTKMANVFYELFSDDYDTIGEAFCSMSKEDFLGFYERMKSSFLVVETFFYCRSPRDNDDLYRHVLSTDFSKISEYQRRLILEEAMERSSWEIVKIILTKDDSLFEMAEEYLEEHLENNANGRAVLDSLS